MRPVYRPRDSASHSAIQACVMAAHIGRESGVFVAYAQHLAQRTDRFDLPIEDVLDDPDKWNVAAMRFAVPARALPERAASNEGYYKTKPALTARPPGR